MRRFGTQYEVRRYRRRLPHIDAPGCFVFVTWRLRGSLPRERVFDREHIDPGEAFLALDRILDAARSGPVHLRRSEIARTVCEYLHSVEANGLCSLHAYAVMPNHVHVLWTPRISMPILIQRVKGTTAFAANRILGRRREAFWQEEYFDRLVRTELEVARIRRYVEWNPVAAALVASPEDFQWSSAYAGLKPRAD